LLRDAARRVKGLTLRLHDSTTSILEGVLARGDRRLANVIEDVYLGGGRFDSWEEHLRIDLWQAALERHRIPVEHFLGTIPTSSRLPWDHFDIGLEEGFLLREYRKALAGRASPPCGKVAGYFIHATNVADAEAEKKRLVCYDCGVACDLGKMRSERIEFLRAMGAHEPGQRARLPVLNARPAEPAATPSARLLPKAYRPTREGKVQRFRLRFEKTGAATLLSHLDLIRELPRAVRRAGARTAYTRGFHPKPDMTFSPALSLGVASLDEYLDIGLVDPPEPTELLDRLARATSGGLRFIAAVRLEPKDPSVSAVVDMGRYLIAFAAHALKDIGGRDGLQARLDAFLAKSEFIVRRDLDGIGKLVDVRKFTHSARLGDLAAEQTLLEAGLLGALVPLEVTLRLTQNGSTKLTEVVEAITGERSFPHHAVRVALLAGDKTPLDVAAFRKPKPQPENAVAANA